MPVKLDENLKKRRKPEEPGESAKEEPQKRKNFWEIAKQKLANPITQKVVFSTAVLLFLAAVILILLYFLKLRSITDQFRAATKIYQFMQRYNESFRGKNLLETFKGVEGILEELQQRHSRNDELEEDIDDIISKLDSNWIPYRGNLYHFHREPVTFEDAKKACKKDNAELPEIHSNEEQAFFLELVFTHDVPCWIGILKLNFEWVWIYSGLPTDKVYWSRYAPRFQPEPGPICMEFLPCAITQRPNCWHDVRCSQKRNFFCRLKLNPKWL